MRYWLTPDKMYAALDSEFRFDFDPCPHPRPAGYDGLSVEWGTMNYVNPPFRRTDGNTHGPTAFVRKAINEQQKGRSSVLLLPVQSYVNLLLEAWRRTPECREDPLSRHRDTRTAQRSFADVSGDPARCPMILFLSSWHILIVIGLFLGCSAFLGVAGILMQAWRVYEAHEDDETVRHERRSAAAKKGHETRKERLRLYDEVAVESRARVDAITPDDALPQALRPGPQRGFIRGEDQHAK